MVSKMFDMKLFNQYSWTLKMLTFPGLAMFFGSLAEEKEALVSNEAEIGKGNIIGSPSIQMCMELLFDSDTGAL